jgi:hypothetical protein
MAGGDLPTFLEELGVLLVMRQATCVIHGMGGDLPMFLGELGVLQLLQLGRASAASMASSSWMSRAEPATPQKKGAEPASCSWRSEDDPHVLSTLGVQENIIGFMCVIIRKREKIMPRNEEYRQLDN